MKKIKFIMSETWKSAKKLLKEIDVEKETTVAAIKTCLENLFLEMENVQQENKVTKAKLQEWQEFIDQAVEDLDEDYEPPIISKLYESDDDQEKNQWETRSKTKSKKKK